MGRTRGGRGVTVCTHSVEETQQFGERLGKAIPTRTLLALFGELGAGKTTLIKGIAAGVTGCSPDLVTSPTFLYLHIYEGPLPFFHYDLYRLKNADEFLSLGLDEHFGEEGVCCIEWADRIEEILPPDAVRLFLEAPTEEKRTIRIENAHFALPES